MISVGLQTEPVDIPEQFECQRMDGNFVQGCYNDKCWLACKQSHWAFQRQFECWRMGEKFVLGCYNDNCWFANRVRAFQRQFECQQIDGKFVLGCHNDIMISVGLQTELVGIPEAI